MATKLTLKRSGAVLGGVAALAIAAAGCGSSGDSSATTTGKATAALPHGSERVKLDPANFTTKIDNPYWPMRPGSRWVSHESDPSGGGVQRVDTTVTNRTKMLGGVKTRVVHDVLHQGGKLVEDTYDWYAQDRAGNIRYFGEDTKEYDAGKVSTKGSWATGVHGAQPGVVVPAHPAAGMSYRQEYSAGSAEDAARVLSVDEQVQVPYGHFTGAMLTKDYTAIEPKVLEYKLYAKGVGPVLTFAVSGGGGDEKLVSFHKGRG